jgi:hypothetical protein
MLAPLFDAELDQHGKRQEEHGGPIHPFFRQKRILAESFWGTATPHLLVPK